MAQTSDLTLRLESVTKYFNRGTQDEKRALNSVDLSVFTGDFITVIGSNGAGKTTLLNVIAGTHQADEGRMAIQGKDVTRSKEHSRARHLSRVFQNPTTGTAGS